MKVILDKQAKALADKDRIPLDTIGAYTDTCGTSYYWIHALIEQKIVFAFDECMDIEEGLIKAEMHLK